MNYLQSVSKAIAGALVGAVVLFLAKHNIVVDASLNDALQTIIVAVIGFAGVYFAPKNK
jgi:hypothetical protein